MTLYGKWLRAVLNAKSEPLGESIAGGQGRVPRFYLPQDLAAASILESLLDTDEARGLSGTKDRQQDLREDL